MRHNGVAECNRENRPSPSGIERKFEFECECEYVCDVSLFMMLGSVRLTEVDGFTPWNRRCL